MPDLVPDFAPVAPLPAEEPGDVREDAPWLYVLSVQERLQMRSFAAVIWPDRQITKRLRRHVITTPTGHKFAAFGTIEECWLYAEAHELAPVGLACGGRVNAVNPPPLPLPPSDPNQMGLFDRG